MSKTFNLRHPFFLPLWRRVVTTGITGGWALVELSAGNVFWAILFGAAALWCAYEFFVSFDPENFKDTNG